jgi:hypothetical protein
VADPRLRSESKPEIATRDQIVDDNSAPIITMADDVSGDASGTLQSISAARGHMRLLMKLISEGHPDNPHRYISWPAIPTDNEFEIEVFSVTLDRPDKSLDPNDPSFSRMEATVANLQMSALVLAGAAGTGNIGSGALTSTTSVSTASSSTGFASAYAIAQGVSQATASAVTAGQATGGNIDISSTTATSVGLTGLVTTAAALSTTHTYSFSIA